VVIDPISRRLNFDDSSLTENTRAAYPLEFIDNHVPAARGGHPQNIFFLSADAYGVYPPVARLTEEQIRYYFLSGYTSKLAGTETASALNPRQLFQPVLRLPFTALSAYLFQPSGGKYNQA